MKDRKWFFSVAVLESRGMNIAIGSLNYDIILQVERMPSEHEKLSALSRTESCGGSAANTAHWLALFGLPMRMYGAAGNDYYGGICIRRLEAVGISCSGVQIVPGAQTRLYCVIVSPNSKRMVGSGNAHEMFDPGALSTEGLAAGSICHFLGRDFGKLKPFLAQARKARAIISCDANGADCRPMLSYVDYAFMNEDELRRSAGGPDPFAAVEAAARQSASHVAVTQGRSGAVLLGGPERISREAFVVQPVDRTGGGDSFDAGFLFGLKTGRSYEASMDLGLKLASAVISRQGTRPDITLP